MGVAVKHIVMFRLKDACTDEDFDTVCKGLLDLPAKIPEISQHEIGRDLVLPSGQNHPAGKNRQIAWTIYCKNSDDYNTYDQHEAHQYFLKNILGPRVQPGSRAAIQYEV
eukprot:scaffold795_cov113-Cylindrotheca_fusiformis.AAC.3